ncbi:cytochrome c3 family protein [Frigoriglobus tundricola]|uniref:Doubled CXXCH motif domain-containing protein n=1 Tax=Frigoriglobus tundricola TaxID=2774151 RepID=A0A6M5Z3I6_9BACT|nr:cytochrome c3 family protein [Frigoriglobus tundricola]QJX00666.1 hypothetical protein FTUN_8298 [Frigoriglobus tundricola]
MPRPLRAALFILIGAALLLFAAWAWYGADRPDPPRPPTAEATAPADTDDFAPDGAAPDPRVTFPTPFRNVKPGVAYVGDQSCEACHRGICDTYHAHPMGRSATTAPGPNPIERYDARANIPFRVEGYQLNVTRAAESLVHRLSANDADANPLPEYVIATDLIIGSGTRGRSYLSTEKGAVWQSPISWFSQDARWDVSPGFDLGTGGRRAIGADCLFCHVDRAEPVPRSLNRYRTPLLPLQAAIGCERCHGPGALHVSERSDATVTNKIDTSIVNPKHLSPELRASVCAQCHLQGQERVPRRGREVFEFRPGLPFEQFVSVFVPHPDVADMNRSVGQFEQLEQSRCSAAGGGRLGCTDCHDPHAAPAPASRDQFYRGRCQTCHESKGCTAPLPERQGKRDSCVACHMPRAGSSNIPHTSVTDHRILRRPAAPSGPKRLPGGATPLVAFRTGPHAPPEPERQRDLGIALASVAVKLPANPGGPQRAFATLAEDRLTTALKTWRGDPDAWHALSLVRAVAGDTQGRFQAASAAVRSAPESDLALAELVEAALAARSGDRAEEAATSWVRLNPTAVEPLLARAAVFTRRAEWGKAERDARSALAIQPLHPEARLVLAVCRHHLGDVSGGRKGAETAAGLATSPQQREAMRDWYRRRTR